MTATTSIISTGQPERTSSASETAACRRCRCRVSAPKPPNDSGDWIPDASPTCWQPAAAAAQHRSANPQMMSALLTNTSSFSYLRAHAGSGHQANVGEQLQTSGHVRGRPAGASAPTHAALCKLYARTSSTTSTSSMYEGAG